MRAPTVESAASTAPGSYRLEFGHAMNVDTADVRTQSETFTVSRGVGTAQQIDVTMPWQVEASTGQQALAGDVRSLYKAGSLWTTQDGRIALGAFLRNTMPTSTASRTGGNNYTVEPGLILSQVSDRSIFSLNTAALVQTRGDEAMHYGAAYERVWEKVGWYVEATGTTDFKRNLGNESAQASTGLEFMLGKRWTLDAGGSKGITGTAPNWGVHTGTTVTF